LTTCESAFRPLVSPSCHSESGHIDSPHLSETQTKAELDAIHRGEVPVEGAPPNRKAKVGEHTWEENPNGWCRHSTEVCVTGPYDPRTVRTDLEAKYGAENVTSTTVPGASDKNVGLAGGRHPSSDVVYDTRGFPIFDQHTAADLKISAGHVAAGNYAGQMRAATRELRKLIQEGRIPANTFTEDQLRAIKSGLANIPDYTWHHHQDVGRMQLVPTSIHSKTGHIGGSEMWYGR
jgi:hypothetical protein